MTSKTYKYILRQIQPLFLEKINSYSHKYYSFHFTSKTLIFS